MSKSKDKVINKMRKIATSKPEHIDIISLLALKSLRWTICKHTKILTFVTTSFK